MSRPLLDGYLHAAVLQREIEVLRGKLQPHDTGHIYTAINVLEQRIEEILGRETDTEAEGWTAEDMLYGTGGR